MGGNGRFCCQAGGGVNNESVVTCIGSLQGFEFFFFYKGEFFEKGKIWFKDHTKLSISRKRFHSGWKVVYNLCGIFYEEQVLCIKFFTQNHREQDIS